MKKEQFYSRAELEEMGQIIKGEKPLIDRRVKLGDNNTFYPSVVIEIDDLGIITLGSNNVFFPMAFLFVAQGGQIEVGDNNQFGDGGVSIKANIPGAKISIGSSGRYLQSPQILGKETSLGDGSQIIGNITVQNVTLDGGGNFSESNPDNRGAVLKGMGTAKNIHLQKGDVLNGWGTFDSSEIERQIKYHPQKKDNNEK